MRTLVLLAPFALLLAAPLVAAAHSADGLHLQQAGPTLDHGDLVRLRIEVRNGADAPADVRLSAAETRGLPTWVSPSRLTLPAHGIAFVDVLVETRDAGYGNRTVQVEAARARSAAAPAELDATFHVRPRFHQPPCCEPCCPEPRPYEPRRPEEPAPCCEPRPAPCCEDAQRPYEPRPCCDERAPVLRHLMQTRLAHRFYLDFETWARPLPVFLRASAHAGAP